MASPLCQADELMAEVPTVVVEPLPDKDHLGWAALRNLTSHISIVEFVASSICLAHWGLSETHTAPPPSLLTVKDCRNYNLF